MIYSLKILTRLLLLSCTVLDTRKLFVHTVNFTYVTTILVKTVDSIKSKGLNYFQFQELILDIEAEYYDVEYFCEVR